MNSELKRMPELEAEKMQYRGLQPTQKALCFYDIVTSTLTIPDNFSNIRGLPRVLYNYPESMLKCGDLEYPMETQERINSFYAAIRRGDPNGKSDIYCVKRGEKEYWERLEFATIFDSEDKPIQAIIGVNDITDYYSQSEENNQLREETQILQILAQHSGRTICCYDPKTGFARHWGKQNCENCFMPRLCERPYTEYMKSDVFTKNSVPILETMFAEIEAGDANGDCVVQLNMQDGGSRWVDLKYSTICDEQGETILAIFSFADATSRHQQELAYLRELQFAEDERDRYIGTLEVNLTEDRIEAQGGKLSPPGISEVGNSFTAFGRRMVEMKFFDEDKKEGFRFFSRDYLLKQFENENRRPSGVWKMRFRNGVAGWVRCDAILLRDPYVGHVYALIKLTDVSEAWKAQLAVQTQAWHDGMTGLLNRTTAETQIRRRMAERSGNGGVLVLLDLDDLKIINDTYGHEQGDRALRAVAEQMAQNFRSGDVVGRLGGDEFIAYLVDAADNKDAIIQSVSNLIRKIADTAVGVRDEYFIHCSAGCAVEQHGEDSFEELYRRADLALYHVKRNGKNNFAFYCPEMKQESYLHPVQPIHEVQEPGLWEAEYLSKAISSYYPMLLEVNLTRNRYRLCNIPNKCRDQLPTTGSLDELIDAASGLIHPEDVGSIRSEFSRQALLEQHRNGESIHRVIRYGDHSEDCWLDMLVLFFTDDAGNACNYTLIRQIDEREITRLAAFA